MTRRQSLQAGAVAGMGVGLGGSGLLAVGGGSGGSSASPSAASRSTTTMPVTPKLSLGRTVVIGVAHAGQEFASPDAWVATGDPFMTPGLAATRT